MQLNCKLYCTFTSGNFYIHRKNDIGLFWIGSWCLSVGMQAAKVDTLSVHSDAMNKEVQVITICPDKAMAGRKMYPYFICFTDMGAMREHGSG